MYTTCGKCCLCESQGAETVMVGESQQEGLKSRMVGEPVMQSLVSSGTFEIFVEKKAGEALGVDVDTFDMERLRITKLKAGLIEDWNAKNPVMQVQVGDYITEINGQSTADKLLEIVKDSASLRITIFRP
mmetsp:Transcript_109623/g.194410  ORF Transcript_109623/g.194410 Transcript_109623/m.194410 type:complete len:130 (+) Transcript_109623:94-483(+)